MLAMIRADAYRFLAFLDLTCLMIQEQMFSSCTMPPESKETQLGSSAQEASPSACKNTGVVSVPR